MTSYRNTTARRAYPFGHGLTYSAFEWGDVSSVKCPTASPAWEVCLGMTVTNTGQQAASMPAGGRALSEAATDTPQLYLKFPPEARQPRSILKGFAKTALLQPTMGH